MKRLKYQIFFVICILLTTSCQRAETSFQNSNVVIAYDIFPVIGQSNAYNGLGYDSTLDKSLVQIKQLGRFSEHNFKIIPAKEPLEHHNVSEGCIGFATHFSKLYLQHYAEGGREVLLIPGAMAGSSFRNYQWRKGDTLYNDIVQRIKYVLQKYPGSEVKAFLWHQGEGDTYWGRYYGDLLDKMITDMRRDIAGSKGDSIPFLVGGLVPFWVDKLRERKIADSVIAETPTRLPFVGYASAREPFVISKADNNLDDIHFDAGGQRILAQRYFNAYKVLHK